MAALDIPLTVGDEIRIARKQAGMEQGELAIVVGVSRPTLSNWERNRSEPTITQFRVIAEATGARWLLRERSHQGDLESRCLIGIPERRKAQQLPGIGDWDGIEQRHNVSPVRSYVFVPDADRLVS